MNHNVRPAYEVELSPGWCRWRSVRHVDKATSTPGTKIHFFNIGSYENSVHTNKLEIFTATCDMHIQ